MSSFVDCVVWNLAFWNSLLGFRESRLFGYPLIQSVSFTCFGAATAPKHHFHLVLSFSCPQLPLHIVSTTPKYRSPAPSFLLTNHISIWLFQRHLTLKTKWTPPSFILLCLASSPPILGFTLSKGDCSPGWPTQEIWASTWILFLVIYIGQEVLLILPPRYPLNPLHFLQFQCHCHRQSLKRDNHDLH